jgi:hypothetical protein
MTRRRRAVQLPLPLEVPPLPAAVRAELRVQVVPGWAGRAACASRSVDPEWWHAPADDELQEVARGVCQGCPVRRSCLAHAIGTRGRSGTSDRRRVDRTRRDPPPGSSSSST